MSNELIWGLIFLGFIVACIVTAYVAYKNVACKGESVAITGISNGEVPLDDICELHLKLTNLEDVKPF